MDNSAINGALRLSKEDYINYRKQYQSARQSARMPQEKMIQGEWLEEKVQANELFGDPILGRRINDLTKYTDGMISPLMLEYYKIRNMGYGKTFTIEHMERKYKNKYGV